MTAMDKTALRAVIRSKRPDESIRQLQSRQICEHILESPYYRHAEVLGGYIPLQHEADVLPVLLNALRSGRKLVIPLCGPAPHMTLRHVRSLDELTPGAYGIPEPPPEAEVVDVSDVDLLLVPLEGIDDRGYRLGKGGGYYDCLLSGKETMAMGCALTHQIVAQIPHESWDIPLPACAAPDGIRLYDFDKYLSAERTHKS